MSKIIFTAISCSLLCSASICQAERSVQHYFTPPIVAPTVRIYCPTPWQGVLEGRADLIRARAQAAYWYGAARGVYQDVRRAKMVNDGIRVLNHWDNIKMRKQRYAEERERNRQYRERRRARRIAEKMAAADHDVAVAWPAALRTSRFATNRQEIESLIRLKKKLGDRAGDSIRQVLRQNLVELAKKIVVEEKSGRLNKEQSKIVRGFVRSFYRNGDASALPAAELLANK